MSRACAAWFALLFVVLTAASGCNSPSRADQGALFGGLTGAGVGALVGNAVGNTGAGAAIGAGVGAVSGAAVGGSLDEIEARNRAQIESQLGRQVAAGATNIGEVVDMTRAGVADDLIINHVRARGMNAPLGANDLVYLQNQSVSTRVIEAMQTSPPRVAQVVQPRPVVVREVYAPDCWHPHYYDYHHHHHHHRPHHGVHWGVSFGH